MMIRRMLGLAAIGGLLYAHKKHGGEWTVDSFKRSGRDLLDAAKQRSQDIRTKTSDRAREVADRLNTQQRSETSIDENVSATATTGYGYGGGYPQR